MVRASEIGFSRAKDGDVANLCFAMPDFNETFIIEIDASNVGIGAVSMQKGYAIGFFNKKNGPLLQASSTFQSQRELFVIMEVVHKWREYLISQRFIIWTDHKSIIELMQQVIQTPVIIPWFSYVRFSLRKLKGTNWYYPYHQGAPFFSETHSYKIQS